MIAVVVVSVPLVVSGAQAAYTPTPVPHHPSGVVIAKPQLTLKPKVVAPGGRLTFIGSGFRPNENVWLGVGPPQSEAFRWGSTRANRAGAFRKTFTVNRHVKPGRWIAIACQNGCRIKAGAFFRTALGQG